MTDDDLVINRANWDGRADAHAASARHTLTEGEFTSPALEFPYYEQSQPLVVDEGGTYVETDADFPDHRDP